MYARAKRHKGVTLDVWPGFVDALATLLIVMIFALMIFVVSQIYLSDALQGTQKGLDSLQAKLNEISKLLHVEKTKNSELTSSYTASIERFKETEDLKNKMVADLTQQLNTSNVSLEQQTQLTQTAQIDLASLKQQI